MPPMIVAMKANRTSSMPIVGETDPVCAVSRIAAAAGEQRRERERRGDHPVGVDAEQARMLEVLGRGAHLRAQRRPPEEEPDRQRAGPASRRR